MKSTTKEHKKALEKLIMIGKDKGYLTYAELNDVTCNWPYFPSNENGDYKNFKVLQGWFACYEQSDCVIYSWYNVIAHDM